MARCEECIHKNVCLHKANIQTDTYAYMGVNYDTKSCKHFKSVADVAPKSEVERLTVELEAMRTAANSYKMHYENLAREIFAEIDEIFVDYKIDRCLEKRGLRRIVSNGEDIEQRFAELKKKYTEGE